MGHSDTAEFTVLLNDKISGNAKAAANSLSMLERSASRSLASLRAVSNMRSRIGDVAMTASGIDTGNIYEKFHRSVGARSSAMARSYLGHQADKAIGLDKIHGMLLDQKLENHDAQNLERRKRGMKELPSLMAKSPSLMAKGLQAMNLGGLNTGTLGNILEAAPTLAPMIASVYALKTAFDLVAFSVKTVTSTIFNLSASIAEATFSALNFAQRMELGFGAMLQNKELGKDVFNAVRKEAQAMSLDIDSTAESFRKLLAAQFTVGEAMDLTKSMADLKAAGASASDVQHALLAISQIKMKGKLQAEELTRQLANAGVSSELVYQEIEKSLGMRTGAETPEQLKANRNKILAMQKGGKISSEVAVPAIIRAIGRKTGSATPGALATAKGAATLEGKITKLQGALRNFFIDVAQMMQGPVEGAIQTVLRSLLTLSESPAITKLKTNLAGIFIALAGFVESNWPAIEAVLYGVAETVSVTFETISTYVKENGNTIAEKLLLAAQVGLFFGIAMFKVTAAVFKVGDAVLSVIKVLEPYMDLIAKIMNVASYFAKIPGLGGFGLAMQTGSFGAETWGQSKSFLESVTARGARSQAETKEEAALYGGTSGLDSLLQGIPSSGGDGKSLVNVKDLLSQGFGKSITTGNINVDVKALDLEDPEVAARVIGGAVRRELFKAADEAG